MKVYISADIEGITGTTHWDETDKAKADYTEFRQQMTAEVAAACEGALKAGVNEIWVKDAHDSARNIIAAQLPPETRLNRGWSGHPYFMMDRLDSTFQAVVMIGYHSRAGSGASPLAHVKWTSPEGARTFRKCALHPSLRSVIRGLRYTQPYGNARAKRS